MEYVEEPLSGALVPAQLSEKSLLLCTGLRSKRIAMMDVQVYALAVYGEPEAIFGSKLNTIGSVDDPVGVLFSSTAEKTFSLTFLRNVSKSQIRDGFTEVLGKKGVPKQEIDQLVDNAPASIAKGFEFRFTVTPQTGEMLVGVGESADGAADARMHLPEATRGLHEVYFGAQPVVKGLAESLQRQQPWLMIERFPENDQAAENSFARSSEGGNSEPGTPQKSDVQQASGGQPRSTDSASMNDSPSMTESPETGSARESLKARSFSWKESSGRTSGKEGYRFGDLTRTYLQKKRRNQSGQSFNDDDCFPGALVVETDDESSAWVDVVDVPRMTPSSIAQQNLSATFLKHHSSAVRGRFIPQWSRRHYELVAGVLQYRRRENGKISDSLSLDGAYVIAEPPKASAMGDCYVFRILMGSSTVCRLSCPNRAVASEWVLAIAGTCAYYHSTRNPTVQTPPREISGTAVLNLDETIEAAAIDAPKDSKGELQHAESAAIDSSKAVELESPVSQSLPAPILHDSNDNVQKEVPSPQAPLTEASAPRQPQLQSMQLKLASLVAQFAETPSVTSALALYREHSARVQPFLAALLCLVLVMAIRRRSRRLSLLSR